MRDSFDDILTHLNAIAELINKDAAGGILNETTRLQLINDLQETRHMYFASYNMPSPSDAPEGKTPGQIDLQT